MQDEKLNIAVEKFKKRPKWYKKLWFITFGLLFFILIVSGGGEKTTPKQEQETNLAPKEDSVYERRLMSITFAESVIKDILKAPSTAEFVDVNAYELSNEKDVWAVNGYVDSQNTFGAMIRTLWEVQLDYRDGKGGTVKSILFDGEKIL